ncbi:MAG TPA: 4-alpha-glucanotransferase [Candidatus Ornithocaccomicrobium faecavium]|uniref:4-alpha-glucanotransferase n=1 Tax=Candidatus Ornithocaccomicrobium faecavium TaxID=2840890 RepID=A0A9D1P8U6_9FIRM|nr:4-alpha-glucanotransferase [Candidatus Ornithocaccomicrobium faecavium]
MADILSARQAGLLLPLSALPSRHGIGDMGETARALVAMLAHAGVRVWQILPLNPLGFGNSPYQPYSSFAGDPIYLSLDDLGVAAPAFRENEPRVDYEAVRAFKEPYLREAFARFQPDEAYAVFVGQAWVREYAIFATFKKHNGMRCWNEWPDAMKHYPEDPALLLDDYEEDIRYEMFLQYAFFQQWSALKEAANLAGIHVMGDIPFYVGIDSRLLAGAAALQQRAVRHHPHRPFPRIRYLLENPRQLPHGRNWRMGGSARLCLLRPRARSAARRNHCGRRFGRFAARGACAARPLRLDGHENRAILHPTRPAHRAHSGRKGKHRHLHGHARQSDHARLLSIAHAQGTHRALSRAAPRRILVWLPSLALCALRAG